MEGTSPRRPPRGPARCRARRALDCSIMRCRAAGVGRVGAVVRDSDGLGALDALDAACRGGADRRRGWEFVQAVAEASGQPLAEGDGVDASRLREAEARLGVPIPAPLREAYLLFGLRTDLTATQDRLVPPGRLRVEDGGDDGDDGDGDGVLVFREENQGCASWGVPVAACAQDDPPVVVDAGDGWSPFAERLSLALLDMVLSEAMFSADESLGDNRELDDTACAALREAFARLPLPDFPFWPQPEGCPVRWYAGPGVLLREDGGGWLWVFGRSAAAVRAVREALPGEWMVGDSPEADWEGLF